MSFPDLYTHMEWADAQVWRAVLATPGEDERLRKLLFHLHMVQRAFWLMWTDGGRDFPPEPASAREVMEWGRGNYPAIQAHVASIDPSRHGEPLILPWAARITQTLGRDPAPSTLGDTLLQVPMHSAYHRGQVNARLRELGGDPPLADYIAWVWFGKPAPEWPD